MSSTTASSRSGVGAGLFSPIDFRGMHVRNRVAMSPMCQYSCHDGLANDWHLAHYGARAIGGLGLIIVEATAVLPEGRITPQCLGIWSGAHVAPLRRIAEFVRERETAIGIQIGHAGVKASHFRPFKPGRRGPVPAEQGGWQPYGPTATRFGDAGPVPDEMSTADIARVQAAFVDAARRAVDAGFQMVELHYAHGYLAHSFNSPLMNRRSDAWGGDFQGRTRFARETVDAVRAAIPDDMPLFVRISATDWEEGGWTIEDSIRLAEGFRSAGVDLVDCSSGGATRTAEIPTGPGYQVPLAAAIRAGAGIATGAVGEITEPAQAEAIVTDGSADLVLLGRELLRDPNWAHRAWRSLGRPSDPVVAPEYQWALAETRD